MRLDWLLMATPSGFQWSVETTAAELRVQPTETLKVKQKEKQTALRLQLDVLSAHSLEMM